jgi:hypothetical protein
MREMPHLVTAWTDGKTPKRYVSRRSAYYAIAKRLICEKYPPGLNEADSEEPYEVPEELRELRAAKARALFWHDDESHFSDRKWRAFVTRVARYLRFVDDKRGHVPRLTASSFADIERLYQRAEADAVELMKVAERYRTILVSQKGPN